LMGKESSGDDSAIDERKVSQKGRGHRKAAMAWRSMTGAIESDAIKENEIRRAERQSAHAFGLGLKRGYEKCGGLGSRV